MKRKVWFVGTAAEVAHQAAPLADRLSFDVVVIDASEVASAASEGDLAVFFSEHFERFRRAVIELREKRVGTVYLVDGILEWRNAWENRDDEPACPFTMRPVLSDKVASIGFSQSRILHSWSNGPKVETVGIPRLDGLRSRWRESDFSVTDADVSRVLVMTAKTPGFTPKQIETTKQSLIAIREFLTNQPQIGGRKLEVTWRLTAGLAESIGVENRLDDFAGGDVQNAIQSSDVVITTPSTTMLEAMLLRKPVAMLDFHHCPGYVPAVWNINSRESIGPVMKSLLNPTGAKLNLQDALLCDAMQMSESAVDRFERLAGAMFEAIEQQAGSGKALAFEANLLGEKNHVVDSFAHEKVFERFDEFSRGELTELQAELAHARREVQRQKQIAKQLAEELGQAHEIFEQIQKHPIAGPVVRIRERVLNLLQRSESHNGAGATASPNQGTSD